MTVIFLCMTGPEKAIRKINRKGQGGEEYISCRSVTLDEENNEMFINDFLARKIKVYDWREILNEVSNRNKMVIPSFIWIYLITIKRI